MGKLYDQAVAQAESQLRKKLDHYRSHSKHRIVKIWGGVYVPEWIAFAVAYAQHVVTAYAKETLDPGADDPHERVAEMERHLGLVCDYLFRKYFHAHAVIWNARPSKEQGEDDFEGAIDGETFRFLVATYGKSPTSGIAEWVHQTITAFWEARASTAESEDHVPKNESQPHETPISAADEKIRRERLFADYKEATGNPSNKRIYEAKNSGIHKPEFYEWLNGRLPVDSATAINFERFLKLKKPPTPRNPKE